MCAFFAHLYIYRYTWRIYTRCIVIAIIYTYMYNILCVNKSPLHTIIIYIIGTCIPYAASATANSISASLILYIYILELDAYWIYIYRIEEMTYYAPHALLYGIFLNIQHAYYT